MLIEFASVLDALRCAVEVQRGMAERNAEVWEISAWTRSAQPEREESRCSPIAAAFFIY